VTKKYWRRSAACCIVKTTAHRIACLSSSNGFARTGGYRPKLPNSLPRGPLWFVLVLHFFLAPPPGERCGRGWSQLGGGHSVDAFWRDLGGKRPRRWCTNRASHGGGGAEGGFLPELTDLVGDGGSFEKDGSGWDTVVTGGTRLGDALRSSWEWERLQGHAKVNTTDDYEGLLVEPGTTGAVGRQLS
jgi:hypothetical protein